MNITMLATEVMAEMPMRIILDGDERETLIDPQVKRIDKMGRVYIDRNLAEKIVVVMVVPTKLGDKEKYMKVGRS